MWEFPNGRVQEDPREGLASTLKTGYNLRLRKNRPCHPLGIVHHGYSHFSVSVYAYVCEVSSEASAESLKWVSVRKLDEYPMGRIDRQIAWMLQGGNSS
jgi:adenine-specific DNA glycosylase